MFHVKHRFSTSQNRVEFGNVRSLSENSCMLSPKVLLVAGGLFIASRLSAKVNAAQMFKFSLDGIPGFDYQGTNLVVTLPIGVSNATKERVEVSKVFGQGFMNGRFIGDFTSTENIVIEPLAHSVVNAQIKLYVSNAITSLIALFNEKGDKVFEVRGQLVTFIGTFPFTISRKVKL